MLLTHSMLRFHINSLTLSALFVAGTAALSYAQDNATPKLPSFEEAKSRIKKTGAHEYELGSIKFNSETREISFPASINMSEGALEYALVHVNGKTHESLLKTQIKGFDLNVVMLLCRFEPHIAELTAVLKEVRPELQAEAAKPLVKPGANHLKATVQWKDEKGAHALTIQQMVINLTTGKPLTAPHFTYNGSQLFEGHFEADSEGSYIALYVDFLALINSVELGNVDDKRWIVNTAVTPPVDTPVTVVFSPSEVSAKPPTKE